jgi:RNA polymerase sigma-70 factor, ECF subfamily
MSNERDLHLLRRIVERDHTSFTELYLAYRPRLRRFLRRKTSQHDLIENAINETLWIVWQKSVGFRGSSRVSTWIFGIAQRCALNLLRKSAAPQPMPETQAALAPDVLLFDENRQWLDRAMEELPREQRIALELSCIGGHSCEEIAAIMHCPVNTVKTRMFHARVNLRQSLPRLAEATQARNAWGTPAPSACANAAPFFT